MKQNLRLSEQKYIYIYNIYIVTIERLLSLHRFFQPLVVLRIIRCCLLIFVCVYVYKKIMYMCVF